VMRAELFFRSANGYEPHQCLAEVSETESALVTQRSA
jgi:hypothetical protein